MSAHLNAIRVITICAASAIAAPHFASLAAAQRHDDWEWSGNYQRLTRLNPGTYLTVRTTQSIDSTRRDGRVFPGVIAEDVWDDYGRLAVPAIPRGSRVDLVVRTARDNDLILDLESIYAHGQRYAVNVAPERLESDGRRHRGEGETAAYLGGGALLGTIIGSVAGGGKGAAIGAGAGAAAGLGGLAFRGRSIRVPAGSRLTFQLAEELVMGTERNRNNRGPLGERR